MYTDKVLETAFPIYFYKELGIENIPITFSAYMLSDPPKQNCIGSKSILYIHAYLKWVYILFFNAEEYKCLFTK